MPFSHPAVLCRVHSHTLHSMTMVMVMLVLVDAFASSINSLQSINYVKWLQIWGFNGIVWAKVSAYFCFSCLAGGWALISVAFESNYFSNVLFFSTMLFTKVQSWSRREHKWKQEEITNLLGVKSAYHGRKQLPELSVCSHNSVLGQMFIDATESSLSSPEEWHPSCNHFGSSCTDSIRYVLNGLQLTFFLTLPLCK